MKYIVKTKQIVNNLTFNNFIICENSQMEYFEKNNDCIDMFQINLS